MESRSPKSEQDSGILDVEDEEDKSPKHHLMVKSTAFQQGLFCQRSATTNYQGEGKHLGRALGNQTQWPKTFIIRILQGTGNRSKGDETTVRLYQSNIAKSPLCISLLCTLPHTYNLRTLAVLSPECHPCQSPGSLVAEKQPSSRPPPQSIQSAFLPRVTRLVGLVKPNEKFILWSCDFTVSRLNLLALLARSLVIHQDRETARSTGSRSWQHHKRVICGLNQRVSGVCCTCFPTWICVAPYPPKSPCYFDAPGVFGVSEDWSLGAARGGKRQHSTDRVLSLYLSALGSGKAKMQASEVISFSENFVLGLRPSSWDNGPESILLSWIHSQPQGASEGGAGKENGKAGLGLIHPFLAVRTGPNDLTSFSISFLGGHWEE
ncbi:hypothetical protein ACRRTK_000093 [Alexandromys fortis]